MNLLRSLLLLVAFITACSVAHDLQRSSDSSSSEELYIGEGQKPLVKSAKPYDKSQSSEDISKEAPMVLAAMPVDVSQEKPPLPPPNNNVQKKSKPVENVAQVDAAVKKVKEDVAADVAAGSGKKEEAKPEPQAASNPNPAQNSLNSNGGSLGLAGTGGNIAGASGSTGNVVAVKGPIDTKTEGSTSGAQEAKAPLPYEKDVYVSKGLNTGYELSVDYGNTTIPPAALTFLNFADSFGSEIVNRMLKQGELAYYQQLLDNQIKLNEVSNPTYADYLRSIPVESFAVMHKQQTGNSGLLGNLPSGTSLMNLFSGGAASQSLANNIGDPRSLTEGSELSELLISMVSGVVNRVSEGAALEQAKRIATSSGASERKVLSVEELRALLPANLRGISVDLLRTFVPNGVTEEEAKAFLKVYQPGNNNVRRTQKKTAKIQAPPTPNDDGVRIVGSFTQGKATKTEMKENMEIENKPSAHDIREQRRQRLLNRLSNKEEEKEDKSMEMEDMPKKPSEKMELALRSLSPTERVRFERLMKIKLANGMSYEQLEEEFIAAATKLVQEAEEIEENMEKEEKEVKEISVEVELDNANLDGETKQMPKSAGDMKDFMRLAERILARQEVSDDGRKTLDDIVQERGWSHLLKTEIEQSIKANEAARKRQEKSGRGSRRRTTLANKTENPPTQATIVADTKQKSWEEEEEEKIKRIQATRKERLDRLNRRGSSVNSRRLQKINQRAANLFAARIEKSKEQKVFTDELLNPEVIASMEKKIDMDDEVVPQAPPLAENVIPEFPFPDPQLGVPQMGPIQPGVSSNGEPFFLNSAFQTPQEQLRQQLAQVMPNLGGSNVRRRQPNITPEQQATVKALLEEVERIKQNNLRQALASQQVNPQSFIPVHPFRIGQPSGPIPVSPSQQSQASNLDFAGLNPNEQNFRLAANLHQARSDGGQGVLGVLPFLLTDLEGTDAHTNSQSAALQFPADFSGGNIAGSVRHRQQEHFQNSGSIWTGSRVAMSHPQQ